MDIIAAYEEVGSYRAGAAICGTTHKTVKRAIERAAGKAISAKAAERKNNTDIVTQLVAAKTTSFLPKSLGVPPGLAQSGRGPRRSSGVRLRRK
jgi:hypothetical protein